MVAVMVTCTFAPQPGLIARSHSYTRFYDEKKEDKDGDDEEDEDHDENQEGAEKKESKSSMKHHMQMKCVYHVEHEALHVFGGYKASNILSLWKSSSTNLNVDISRGI